MTRQEYLTEALRYERLATEAHNQVISGAPAEYYETKAREMRERAAG